MPPKRKVEEPAAPAVEAGEASELRRSGRNHPAPNPPPKRPRSKKAAANGDAPADAPVEAPAEEAKAEEPKPEETKEAAVEEAKAEAPASESKAAAFAVGDIVDGDIKLKNQEDTEVTVKELVAEKGAVIFLVPKANTPGCTTQACHFRDDYKAFQDAGFDVYSISQDTPKALTSWKEGKQLTYSLLSDPGQALIKPLGGSAGAKKVTRSHFVLEAKTGKLLLATVGVKPATSAKDTLAFIKAL